MGKKHVAQKGFPKNKAPKSGYSMEGVDINVDKGKKTPKERISSVVRHTTTCPYCGHRVLPKNLGKHVDSQHPDYAAGEKFFNAFEPVMKTNCPYCNSVLELRELEDHIYQIHRTEVTKALERVNDAESREQTIKQRKLEEIAKKYDAPIVKEVEYDGDAPWEWHLAMQSPPGIKKPTKVYKRPLRISGQGFTVCPVCRSPVKNKNLTKHLLKVHGQGTVP